MIRSAVSSLVLWFGRLVSMSIWHALKRLPLYLLAATPTTLAASAILWIYLLPDVSATVLGTASGIVLCACFAAAGWLWSLHRALREGVLNAVCFYETESPKFIDLVLEPLVAGLPLPETSISITEAREFWRGLSGETLWEDAPKSGWFSRFRKTSRWFVGRCVRRQFAALDKVFDSLQAMGETHLSAATLKDYLRDRLVETSASAARSRIRLADYGVAAVVFLLLVTPVGLWRLIPV